MINQANSSRASHSMKNSKKSSKRALSFYHFGLFLGRFTLILTALSIIFSAFNIFSIEVRRLLTDNLVATIFVDYGNISPNFSPEEENKETSIDRQDVIDRTFEDYFSDFRPAVGFGLQYLLPVGPARLDFAWNPDRDKERDEDSFNFHFSIGMAF